MGIVSVIAIAAGIGFLIALRRQINKAADEEGDEQVSWGLRWAARGCALVAILGVVGVVDAYVYPLPSPFEAPAADLPAKSEAPEPREDTEKPSAAASDPMKDAQEQHREALDDFEKRAAQ